MSLRSHYAGLAMQAMVGYGDENTSYKLAAIPLCAVEIADALIAELEKAK